jgi:DNA polymerase III delta prime subunit
MSSTLWVEQYRPQTLEDCILSPRLREVFAQMVETGELQNLLFVGPAGTGKTSVAKALAKDLGLDVLVINGSENTGIDVLRTDIRQFASTYSFSNAGKLVIIDEAEYLNPNSTQPAFRAFVEEFASTCQFILCANYPAKLIPEIHSRFPKIDFTPSNDEKVELANRYLKRVSTILTDKGIAFDKKVLAPLVVKRFPDLRAIIGAIQAHSVGGELHDTVLGNQIGTTKLVRALKEKQFEKIREWVVDHGGADSSTLFREIYDTVLPMLTDPVLFIKLLAEYQYKAAFVADQEINMVAFLTEVMVSVEWRG